MLRIVLTTAMALIALTAFAAEEEKLVNAVSVEGISLDDISNSWPTKPQVAANAEELIKLAGKEAAAVLLNRVDLETSDLLLFRWGGAGADRLTANVVDGAVLFTYKPSNNKDLRDHFLAFAVKKKTKWKVVTKHPFLLSPK